MCDLSVTHRHLCCIRQLQRHRDQGLSSLAGRGTSREDAKALSESARLSEVVRELIRGLNRATLGAFVIDNDRGPCVELLPHLPDFSGQRYVLDAVVRPLAGHERFDDTVQSFRTEHLVGNNHADRSSRSLG
jgi:hypothetical protein